MYPSLYSLKTLGIEDEVFWIKIRVIVVFTLQPLYHTFCALLQFNNGRLLMTSSNGNVFRETGHLCGESTGPGEIPTQRPVTWSFGVFFYQCLNKRLSVIVRLVIWDAIIMHPLWRHYNVYPYLSWLLHLRWSSEVIPKKEMIFRADSRFAPSQWETALLCNDVSH